jgi:hypothetical protein
LVHGLQQTKQPGGVNGSPGIGVFAPLNPASNAM